MNSGKNFFQRAVDALVENRTRQAQRYVAQYQRTHGSIAGKVNDR